MNDYIQDILNAWYEDNGRIGDLTSAIWDRAFEHGRKSKTGLPGVTAAQIDQMLHEEWDDLDDFSLPYAMEKWFNDPNRDAPVEPTIHPDLVWLSSLPPERLPQPKTLDANATVYFYKSVRPHQGNPHVNVAEVRWGACVGPRPPLTWTLSDIEQARRHLAKPKDVKWTTEPLANGNMLIKGRTVLHPDNDSHVDDYLLGLSKLPDYKTWFEAHGSDRLVTHPPGPDRPATVHELYTMFRARLLDELQQAGILGERS